MEKTNQGNVWRFTAFKRTALFVSLAALGSGSAFAGDVAKINWSKIPVVSITLFYPGQSTYEWLHSDAHKGAANDNSGVGTWKDGMWTVVMARPLELTNDDDKALKAGGVYNVGFAIQLFTYTCNN